MGLLGPTDYSKEPSRIPNLVINAKVGRFLPVAVGWYLWSKLVWSGFP